MIELLIESSLDFLLSLSCEVLVTFPIFPKLKFFFGVSFSMEVGKKEESETGLRISLAFGIMQ